MDTPAAQHIKKLVRLPGYAVAITDPRLVHDMKCSSTENHHAAGCGNFIIDSDRALT